MSAHERLTDSNSKQRFEKVVEGSKIIKEEWSEPFHDKNWLQRRGRDLPEPVMTAGTEYVGTARARKSHVDACIHYSEEQVYLKKHSQPIE